MSAACFLDCNIFHPSKNSSGQSVREIYEFIENWQLEISTDSMDRNQGSLFLWESKISFFFLFIFEMSIYRILRKRDTMISY